MAIPTNLLILTLVFAITISLLISPSSSSSSPTIYDALGSHGLPKGLLPKGITNFSMDPTSGRFEVHMERSCDTKFESQVRYDWNFSGVLEYGQIANLSGIAAQDLFLWFPVKGIRVDIPSSGLIYFDVGVVFKRFSLSLFETPRDCTISDEEDLSADLVRLGDRAHIDMIENKHEKLVKQPSPEYVGKAVA